VHGQVVAVIFEANTAAGPRLVAGFASASQVMRGQPAWSNGSSPWILYDVASPRPSRGLVIGLNIHGRASRPDRNPDKLILLLAEPQVRGFAWSAPRSSSSSSSNGVIGLALALQGLAVADTGQVTGPVEVDQLNAAHRITLARPVAVGVPGSEASQVPA